MLSLDLLYFLSFLPKKWERLLLGTKLSSVIEATSISEWRSVQFVDDTNPNVNQFCYLNFPYYPDWETENTSKAHA